MKVAIKTICPMCHKESAVMVNHEDLIRYKQGVLIQECFPYLNDDEREQIKTGFCNDCWKMLFEGDFDGDFKGDEEC